MKRQSTKPTRHGIADAQSASTDGLLPSRLKGRNEIVPALLFFEDHLILRS
jgi:hypothetical protein